MKNLLILSFFLILTTVFASPNFEKLGEYTTEKPEFARFDFKQISDNIFFILPLGYYHFNNEFKNDLPLKGEFKFFNTTKKEIFSVTIDLYDFLSKNKKLFLGEDPVEVYKKGNKKFRPDFTPIFFDETKEEIGFIVKDYKSYSKPKSPYEKSKYLFIYIHWSIKNGFQWSKTLSKEDLRTLFQTIGYDSVNKRLYFYTNYNKDGEPYKNPEEVTVFYLDFKTHDVVELKKFSPKISKGSPHHFYKVKLSPDFKTALFLEYEEFDENEATAYWFSIDDLKISTFLIPLTPYGVIFDKDSERVFIASSKEGYLYIYDTKNFKEIKKIKIAKRIHHLQFSEDKKYIWIVVNSSAGGGDAIQCFSYPQLKKVNLKNLSSWFGQKKIFPQSGSFNNKGDYFFLPTVDSSGFPDKRGFSLFKVNK
ncbi:hypothetical protein JXR93_06135 [bacterium]|nr:hypothetical protein [bacterium]